MAASMTHTERENDVLDEYPLAPLGVCCPALLMSLSVLDLEVSISFYTDKNLLQNLSLSTCIKPTGEVKLFSNCFSLAAGLAWLWVNLVHIMALIGEWVIQAHHLRIAMCSMTLFKVLILGVVCLCMIWHETLKMNCVLMKPLQFYKTVRVYSQQSTTHCNLKYK